MYPVYFVNYVIILYLVKDRQRAKYISEADFDEKNYIL